jgi:hypothetical protein
MRLIYNIYQQEIEMETENMLFNNGYVGSMGINWNTPTAEDLEGCITGAMRIEEKTREEIVSILEAGKSVRWCESPNFYYDQSYGKIGTKKSPKAAEMVRCDCGHMSPKNQVMSAGTGTSCSDCYDKNSF